ncbi:CPBP family intramembrane metalloprotease [Clostridium sp. FP2]|uniref:CPBP family intramembrane glutamic endopeptidase n=1 Tax=Clostridium TaxID=1485 RepID=UPI0013E940B9|nr:MULTISPECIES: type II CAAX endopeptidase family protein [Clostridium]MBW9159309.1 CPBP family intramembrane metalloprotease [Clostridium tagluense]MBZ9626114.1 CPBP family intramembrane metalloprotease [Clostridium sp. FP2]WLC68283.1 CPBP family intramembrane metalloprotease [Clostridium tagluense]
MKIGDFLNNRKDKGAPIITAFFLSCLCMLVSLAVGLIHNFFGMNLLGQLFSVLVLLISFVLIGKILFNVNYSGLFKEIKLSKCDCMDNLLITMFFSSVFALINILIYYISFMINPDKTKSIGYFIKTVASDNNVYTNSSLDILAFIIIVAIGVAAEEIFFRYTAYKIFVKKKEDIKIFIILTSIVFGLYHFSSISRFIATLVMSIFLSIIYVMTKSVVYTFISHVLWNYFISIASVFIVYFKDINTSMVTGQCIIAEIIIISLLALLSIYSYYKRGHILSLNIRNKMHSIKRCLDSGRV